MTATFGHIIKHWRGIRRFSQLALSAESGMSSRHISFLETGRSRPSRGSVLTLTRILEMPKPAINDALKAAGFTPEYPSFELDDQQLEPVNQALMMMLKHHEPFPAIIVDAGWNMIGGNIPALKMMDYLPLNGSRCIVDAMINDDHENPVLNNWHSIAGWTLLRLQHELSHWGENPSLRLQYDKLAADPRLQNVDAVSFAETGPILTTQIRIDGQVLTFFTMMAEFSTVQDVRMSERRVELFFPGDDASRKFCEDNFRT